MKRPLHLMLASVAVLAGVCAAMARNPQPALAEDEIDAIDLAQRLRAAQPDLLVLDARASTSEDRLPGARPLADTDAATIAAGRLVVIVDDDTVERRRVDAWRGRVAVSYRRLRGGVRAWNDEVLFPTVRSDASAREQQAFTARAALSRYFGGSPRRVDSAETMVRQRSRRGC